MMKFILVLALASIACTQTAQLATPIGANASIIDIYTQAPAPLIVAPTPAHVTTLGKLNIRELPDTSSQIIGWYEIGADVVAIAKVSGIGCPSWYLVTYRGERGYICAEWTSK